MPNSPGTFLILDQLDEGASAIDLGANTFSFYGDTYTGRNALYVNTNGLITLGGSDVSFGNGDLSREPAYPSIAPLWDDWRTDVGGADMVLGKFEDTNGDATPDRLIIEWSDVRRHSDTAPAPAANVTFQAILALNTAAVPGVVVFNYPDIDTGSIYSNGASATVGIKGRGPQGGNRLNVSYNDANQPFVASGRAIRLERVGASVAGRYLFYNRSAFDGRKAAADARDDMAVALDKVALLPGSGPAAFANLSSYTRGINGVMVDVLNLPARPLGVADFRLPHRQRRVRSGGGGGATPGLHCRAARSRRGRLRPSHPNLAGQCHPADMAADNG